MDRELWLPLQEGAGYVNICGKMEGCSRLGREKRRKAVMVGPQSMKGIVVEEAVKRQVMAMLV